MRADRTLELAADIEPPVVVETQANTVLAASYQLPNGGEVDCGRTVNLYQANRTQILEDSS